MDHSYAAEVVGVEKKYQEGKVTALQGVDLQISAHAFSALAGPSGSGKTTLLNIIGALDVPDKGVVSIDGQHLESMSESERTRLRREKIGFIFQEFNLVPVLTARENVELALEMLPDFSYKDRIQLAEEMLQQVGLEGLERRFPKELSGGQQQRVAVARALVKKPPIVLADEPTANLDSATGMAVVDLMKGMRDEMGTAFILSTHDPRVIDRTETHIRMIDGRIVK